MNTGSDETQDNRIQSFYLEICSSVKSGAHSELKYDTQFQLLSVTSSCMDESHQRTPFAASSSYCRVLEERSRIGVREKELWPQEMGAFTTKLHLPGSHCINLDLW